MRILIILISISITTASISAKDFSGHCVLDDVNEVLSRLARDVEAACGWSINQVVEKSIMKQCVEAGEKEGVKFTSSTPKKLRFSQFSYTFDTNEPYYYCKNKRGYDSYFAQSTLQLAQEVADNERSKYEHSMRESGRVTPYPAKESVKEVRWRCVIPNYIPIPQIYSTEQKEVLDLTYRDDPRYACAQLK